MIATERLYKNWDWLDLEDEITHQNFVVDNLVDLAEKVAADPDNETKLQGLYFAVDRLKQLQREVFYRLRDENTGRFKREIRPVS